MKIKIKIKFFKIKIEFFLIKVEKNSFRIKLKRKKIFF